MQYNIIHVFGGFAIIQSIIILVFLGNNKLEKNRSNSYLRALLAIFIIQILNNILFSKEINRQFTKYLWIINQFVFLIAPLVYFYIRSFLSANFKHTLKDFYHILPCVISMIYVSTLVFTGSRIWIQPTKIMFGTLYPTQNVIYLIMIHHLLKDYGLNFKTFFSYIQDFRLSWVRYVTIVYIAFWFIYFYIFFLGYVFRLIRWCPYYVSLFSLCSFILLNAIVYIALKKLHIFNNPQKYQKSNLKPSLKKESQKKLKKIMEQEKLYLDPSLNLITLAKKIPIAPCHLSRIINESFNQSFCSFVNYYRVQESIQYLVEDSAQKKNILEIAYKVGFNSKSSFNNAFKKQMNLTPREFRYKHSQ